MCKSHYKFVVLFVSDFTAVAPNQKRRNDTTTVGQFHNQIKAYYCRFCSKIFPSPSHVTKHERIHTGEKPYSCDICGKSFNRQDNMKAHQRVHLTRQ